MVPFLMHLCYIFRYARGDTSPPLPAHGEWAAG